MGDSLRDRLEKQHPWHERQSEPTAWPLAREIFAGFEDDEAKAAYLITHEKIERPEHFATRRKLTQFLGSTPSIATRLTGRIFQDSATVEYEDAVGLGDDDLETFANNADGSGATLEELLEAQAEEVLSVGLVGFLVEKPKRAGDLEVPNRATEKALGLRYPRVIGYRAEELYDWSVDAQGRLEWIKLRRVVRRQTTFDDAEARFIQWIVTDRQATRVFEAKVKGASFSTIAIDQASGLMTADKALEFEDPVEITPPGGVPHGAGTVPFVPLYGQKIGPMMARSPLRGAMRADVAGFNADSGCTFSEWLHGKPLHVVKTERPLSEVIRSDAVAYHLNPADGEDAYYESTPTDGFAHSRTVVENRKLDAHRMAGADPTGIFEGGARPESGVAKTRRFAATEERVLSSLAGRFRDAHHDLLELGARLMAAEIPSVDAQAFTGSVRYATSFDLADANDVIDQYTAAAPFIRSATWHEDQHIRIASLTAGEVSPARRQVYEAEIRANRQVQAGASSSSSTPADTNPDPVLEADPAPRPRGKAAEVPRPRNPATAGAAVS